MKLPRWLVISLLSTSVLAVLGAGVWWWVTWPERVMNDLRAPAVTGSRQREQWRPELVAYYDKSHGWESGNVKPLSRSFTDVLIGRQKFNLGGDVTYVVERGVVVDVEVVIPSLHSLFNPEPQPLPTLEPPDTDPDQTPELAIGSDM